MERLQAVREASTVLPRELRIVLLAQPAERQGD